MLHAWPTLGTPPKRLGGFSSTIFRSTAISIYMVITKWIAVPIPIPMPIYIPQSISLGSVCCNSCIFFFPL